MTDLEFATCDLDRLNEVYATKPKKFYELKTGDPIYCIQIEVRQASGLFRRVEKLQKFKLELFDMQIIDPSNPKARQTRIYLTPRYGFVGDKNVSSFVRYKKIYKGDISLQIYGTSLDECIYKAEKATGIKHLEDKLVWTEANF